MEFTASMTLLTPESPDQLKNAALEAVTALGLHSTTGKQELEIHIISVAGDKLPHWRDELVLVRVTSYSSLFSPEQHYALYYRFVGCTLFHETDYPVLQIGNWLLYRELADPTFPDEPAKFRLVRTIGSAVAALAA